MKDKIKEIRNSKGMNQTAFADWLGVSLSNIQSYETGRRIPSDAFIELLCTKCGINKEWLLNGSGEMFRPKEREEEIAEMVKKMATEDDLFIFKVSQLLYSMNAEQIAVLKKYIKKLADAMDEE